jgi:hypothetical protein
MRDETIVRMLEDACTGLQEVNFPARTPNLLPVYNALLAAARANHPDDPFLNALGRIENNGESGPEEMRVLFGQLRILLESFREP